MLLQFSVSNYRSFKDEQTISLLKSKGAELPGNTFTVESLRFDLLKTAAIYGANASGKSNFIQAMDAMRDIVITSNKNSEGDELPLEPFRLDQQTRAAPCEFEIYFLVDGVRYQYGFAATATRVHEEWLSAYPKGRQQQWFSRRWQAEANTYHWQLGTHLKGQKQVWKNATRDNALFLSTAIQLNSEQLKPVYQWFRATLRVLSTNYQSPLLPSGFSKRLCLEEEGRQHIVDFLNDADIDIDDLKAVRKPLEHLQGFQELPTGLQEVLGKPGYEIEIKTVHQTSQGEPVIFDLEDESEGTQQLFALAGPWMDVLKNGYILFFDELNQHLHPRLVKYLVKLFHSRQTNPNNAQLIFTSHETNILQQDIMRRDQVWFCKKSEKASSLYPLTDFKPRKGYENLKLAYLSGRYGAVPVLGG